MRKYTPEERRAKSHERYLVWKARLHAAGLTSGGKPWAPRVKLTFEQALVAAKERFWAHVRKDADGCWYWLKGLNKAGYGEFKVSGKIIGAHRAAYLLTHGTIPYRKYVCHECDHPSCVNPAHLWAGTQQDNTDDMVRKGRQAKGELLSAAVKASGQTILRGSQRYNSKLSEEAIPLMRQMRANGALLREIGDRFGVTDSTVCHVLRGKRWKHMPLRKEAQ